MSSEEPTTPGSGLPALPPPPPAPAPRPPKSPAVATFLSLFPGLGQVYNGQPAKALVFFFSWVGCIYLTSQGNEMPFAFGIPFVYFYNLVDAYRSAAAINACSAGRSKETLEPVAESPVWGATLAGLGLLLLFNNLGWLDLERWARYWPVLLILAGAGLLVSSLKKQGEGDASSL
jgi:hypothetical protein